MWDFISNYREVIPDQAVQDAWKEISVNTGGTQGTLQDIKIVERAAGFCYRDPIKHHTRNRFIYWRINHDVLELVEHSLDINLAKNRLRYRFIDTPILDGVSIHETYDNIIILVPTVCSVHRLIFPHPEKYFGNDVLGSHPDLASPSIFSEATATDARDPSTFHFFSNSNISSSQLPYLAASSLSLSEEEAHFLLAYSSGEVLLVKQSRDGKIIEKCELKNESMVPRFLSGIADKLLQKDKDGHVTVSLLLHTFDSETYAFTLSRNGQLKCWSCSKGECITSIDIAAESGDIVQNQIQGAQNHIIRKAVDGFDDDCLLGIFVNFSTESQFQIFKPLGRGNNMRLMRFNTLHSPETDLIDFSLSVTRVWCIWRGKDGECQIKTVSLSSKNQWTDVVLESVPDSNQPPNMDGETDPRQAYFQHICHPGRFPLNIISKALNIYKRSTVIADLNLSPNLLKQRICMAVEEEIQSELKETVVSDNEYLECSNYCWQRFYSCCVQYHIAGLKPLGLLLLPANSGAVLLKKSMFSFLRPLDIFEQMLYNCEDLQMGQFSKYMLTDGVNVTEDVMQVFKVINYLDQQMSEVFAYTFEKELSLLKYPNATMSALLKKIQHEMDHEFTDYVAEMLGKCNNLYQAIHKILELLRLQEVIHSSETEYNPKINYIFTSQLGISFVAGCLRQQAQVKFSICRNLLMITNILLMRNELDSNVLETIRSVCIPEIVVLTQAHYTIIWLSNLTAVTYLPTESSVQRLSSLKLSPVFNIRINGVNSLPLLELFIGSTGGYETRKLFSVVGRSYDGQPLWQSSLLRYLNNLFQILWPVNGSPILSEWLLSCGQHLWLQQYVRLLKNWCEWNITTRNFLLATSFLTTGENYKALEMFEACARGIFTDKFLTDRILSPDVDEKRALVHYYLKVIHLFELHKAFNCAIDLANTALSITHSDDPLAATLHSIKFKHNLALKNYEEAFESLNLNPDLERRKDNLRDLVKTLLEEGKIHLLLNFKYGSMEELFCNLIFARARATEATTNYYYDFLYCYQVKRGACFFRLAASVMYEQAFRLSQTNNIDALERQVKCYLAAKNMLSLCEPQFAYIVMPVDQVTEEVVRLPVNAGEDREGSEIVCKKQVNIINLAELENNLHLATAKLKLLRFSPHNYFETTTPSELVVLLAAVGLFRRALEICSRFQFPHGPVLEALTKRCGILTSSNDSSAWKWLIENDLEGKMSFYCTFAQHCCWRTLSFTKHVDSSQGYYPF